MASFVRSRCVGITRAVILGSFSAVIDVCAAADGSHQFLGSNVQQPVTDLLAELEKLGGRDHRDATESRVNRLEAVLRPMFASMSKDDHGRLPATGVRYLLHRLFVQRHAWFVKGLSNDGDAWNSSSPVAVFKDSADDHHELFENHLSRQGFSLHQVAVFGATLEVLVHSESIERLESAYRVLGLGPSETLTESEAKEVMMAYMMMYLQPTNHSSLTPAVFENQYRNKILAYYPTWPETEKFVLEVREAVLEDTLASDRATWATNLMVLEEVAERYGRWQDRECHDLKRELVLRESAGTGRVRLGDFYAKAAEHGKYEAYNFLESSDYLRTLGALDETDPEHISVIIPNYVNSPANCQASSRFYSVCCINECEELLGTLEHSIASPDATPARIIELISKLPSTTVEAPRILPTTLSRRLEEIAAHHGGRVPLHGRLFSQWMHHAYPRECPYPHLSGTTSPMTDHKALELGIRIEATNAEMKSIVQKAQNMPRNTKEFSMPWNPEEEIFVPLSERGSSTNFMRAFFRGIVFLAVMFALASIILRVFPTNGSKSVCYADHKYCV